MHGKGISRRKVLGTLGAVAASGALPHRAIGNPAAPRPNILFILADDMGYADLGCYDSRHISSPALDELASKGVRLTDAYANSQVCLPTRLALATGRYKAPFAPAQ